MQTQDRVQFELTQDQRKQFEQNGYLVIPALASQRRVEVMRTLAQRQLAEEQQPIEYEADVAYPGAPVNRNVEGGDTPRRLLQAYDRDPAFAEWAQDPQAAHIIRQLLNTDELRLTRSHHNCVMTKHPGYSSATLWHQDLRYWSYEKPDLINSWLALGDETPENGCMWLLPGSHRLNVSPEQLDEAKFLRPEHPANRELIDSALPAELHPGDVLFFHAGVFHAAGRNETQQLKLSTVFTYRAADNQPLPGTKSSRYSSTAVA